VISFGATYRDENHRGDDLPMLRRWILVLFGCWLAIGEGLAAHAQTFTPARDELVSARVVTMESAEAWAEEFLALNPNVAAYEIVGPGHVIATSAGGGQIDVYLDNLIDRLSVPSARRGLVLAEYEAGIYDALASAVGQPAPAPENVMPIVRHRDFLAAVLEQAGEVGGEAQAPLHRELAGDAVVVLVYDTASSIAVMSKQSLGLADRTDDEAFALARSNLARRAEGLEWRNEGGLRVAVLDGDYETSLLLLDGLWDDLETALGGPAAVAIPVRGSLVAGRADNPDDVAALRGLIAEAALDPYAVSEDVFVRREGRWDVLAAE
jgi:hypothetical protein